MRADDGGKGSAQIEDSKCNRRGPSAAQVRPDSGPRAGGNTRAARGRAAGHMAGASAHGKARRSKGRGFANENGAADVSPAAPL